LCFTVRACASRDCDCREVDIGGLRIDDDTASIKETARGFAQTLRAGAPPPSAARVVGAGVDLDTGEVIPSQKNQHPDLCDWFRETIDGELLDYLHTLWIRQKGYRAGERRNDADLSDCKPSTMIFFAEVFADERADCYVLDGKRYFADDSYCVNPTCDCCKSRIVMVELPAEGTRDKTETIGTAVVDFERSDVKLESMEVKTPGAGPLLARWWQLFQRRHRVRERLDRRRARLADAVPPLLPAPPRTTRRQEAPGRNAPCPCGSSEKFKRCCIGKAAWA
jgi:hypothetical protein